MADDRDGDRRLVAFHDASARVRDIPRQAVETLCDLRGLADVEIDNPVALGDGEVLDAGPSPTCPPELGRGRL